MFANHFDCKTNKQKVNIMDAATSPIAPKRKSKISITHESITPTRAKLWAKATRETEYSQRKVSQGVVAKYSGEMARGDWHADTGDMVRLATYKGQEVVLDGQHRLAAIIHSGKPQDMYVARNVPQSAFAYIDQGNTRTLKDVMDCDGWADTPTVSAIGRYLWVYSETGSPFGSVSSERNLSAGSLYDWVCEYQPSLREQWATYGPLIKAAQKGLRVSPAVLGFLFVRLNTLDTLLCHDVFKYFSDPYTEKAPSNGFMFAVKQIQEMLLDIANMKARGMAVRSDEHRDRSTLHILSAWYMHLEGKKPTSDAGYKKIFNKLLQQESDLWSIL
jgi:hypothetical protein